MIDPTLIAISVGFILSGVIIAWPLGFIQGQRHILGQIERRRDLERADRRRGAFERACARLRRSDDVLNAEVIE